MTDTFTWRVHADASGGGEFRTLKAQFGEGYAQESPDGMHNDVQKWNVTVAARAPQMRDEILAFIRAQQGMSFYWTPPLGVQGLYKCKRYQPSDKGGAFFTLSMEFEQAFAP